MNKRLGILVIGAALLAGSALAQKDAPSRERELLRRAQAALREATAQRDATLAEKAALQKERDAAREELTRQRSQAARALASEREQATTSAATARNELDSARREASAAQAAAAEREAALRRQLQTTQHNLAERTQANNALSSLLETATKRAGDAERRNDELHTLALDLVDRWRNKSPAQQMADTDPIFGIGAVRSEDQAEALRSRVHALRRPGP